MKMAGSYSGHGIDLRNSDALSETSESGTVTSGFNSNWSSTEELRDFVTKQGVRNIADLHQERFMVDRTKLEQMLSGDNEALMPADIFFAKIMEDTATYITWPAKLKLGAKSKKDPHVRILGKQENVGVARERILSTLGTTSDRVIMKMDVSYTDHSHIIGRGGERIKRVMEETSCHIHFPDSNRSNPLEKSNQVSISGCLERVEVARSRVRELIPLIFGFEPPLTAQNVDGTHPYVVQIQEQYNVQVSFKTRSRLHSTFVVIKGCEWNVINVKQATILLMDFMCKDLVNQIPVQMTIQISPQHHQIVLGENFSNLRAIREYTHCQIMFPDAEDQNISTLKKCHVTISGIIHNVYNARQLLFGSLPLVIMFDLLDTTTAKIRPQEIAEIQKTCDVTIVIREKLKQLIKICSIKGIERKANNVYKARNLILGLHDPPVMADIPPSYYLPNTSTASPRSSVSHSSELLGNHNSISPVLLWHYPSNHNHSLQKSQLACNVQSSNSNRTQSQERASHDDSMLSSISSNNSLVSSPQAEVSSQHDQPSSSGYQSTSERQQASFANYQTKRLAGWRAMQNRPSPEAFRVPTSAWAGYGISHTSPAGLLRTRDDVWQSLSPEEKPSSSDMNTSNVLDLASTNIVDGRWTDLPSLLSSLGLDNYINLFGQHEVDLDVFATLNNKDLVTIGVSAFGSRRKMLLAISELRKQARGFSLAPGAERRTTKNSTSSQENSPSQFW